MDKLTALHNEKDFINEVLDYIESFTTEDKELFKDAIEFFQIRLDQVEQKIEKENTFPAWMELWHEEKYLS